jgi:hypothetical protein
MAKAMLLFLVTSVALGLTSLHLVRELRAERATSESLQARVSALEQAKASQPAPVPATPFATWSVQKVEAPPAGPAPARKPSNGPDGEKLSAVLQAAAQLHPAANMPTQEERIQQMQEHLERQRALLRDPEYREAMRTQHRTAFVRGNPDVVAELGLTSEQANQFFSLMAEQAMRNMDASQTMTYDPTDRATAENAQRKMLDLQRANEAEIAQLLGPQKLKAWKEYQSTLPVRYMANEISQLLASNGLPLQPELTKPLLKVLAQEQQRTLQEMHKQAEAAMRGNHAQTNRVMLQNDYDGKHLERMEEQNRRTREALSSVLTPEQVEIYAKEQDANLHMQRAQWRAMGGAYPHGMGNVAIEGGVGVATMAPMVTGDMIMYASPAAAVPPPDAN